MAKTVIMFPGQGAQYTGMGKTFYDSYACSKECFDIATDVTGIDMTKLIFEENDLLNKTEYTQIALYTTEVAILRALKENGIISDVNIGLSLGEYSAITASGGILYEDGCKIVRKRGIYMENEVPHGLGSMAAVIGMKPEELIKCINDGGFDKVTAANYNCPGQIVISGEKEQLLKCMEALKAAGARRVIELNVSGPFHSVMLKGAGDKLERELESIQLHEITTPYIANYNAEYIYDTKNIKELLAKQVYSSVRFEQSVRRLITDGVTEYIEAGPGKTLTGFVKKIAKDMGADNIHTFNIENVEDVEKIREGR